MLLASISAARCNASSIINLIFGRDTGPQRDPVGDPFHTPDALARLLRTVSLIIPLDRSSESNPAAFDNNLDALPVVRQLRFSAPKHNVTGDFQVRPPIDEDQADLNVVGDRHDPCHVLRVDLGQSLLDIAPHKPGQGDGAIIHRHRDIVRADVGIPPKIVFNVALDLAIGFHGSFRISQMDMDRSLSGCAFSEVI
jgi:hypothetical protein